MDTERVKGKPLLKEETKCLLELIEASNIINNKTTNATNNKLKVEEWKRIAEQFNASAAVCHRTPQQLRLKWENLKKNARKRSAKIRMNNIKTGGGPGEYIPPDDILDRVTSLLGNTASGFEVPFGGDKVEDCGDDDEGGVSGVGVDGGGDVGGDGSGDARVNLEFLDFKEVPINKTRKLLFNPSKSGTILKRRNGPHPSKVAKDIAIAEYLNIKKNAINANIEVCNNTNEKIRLENEKIKLENDNLKLENEKLKLEIEYLKTRQD